MSQPEFDDFAEDYDSALARGIEISGEDKEFFAQGRVSWLANCLERLGARPRTVLDFGCGTGSATPFLLGLQGAESVLGVDISARSVAVAQRSWGAGNARFLPLANFPPAGDVDLAFCNGVFHHIPVPERAAAVELVYRALRVGGYFAFWENNPLNPGTRYVMRRIPFDREAILLWPRAARRLLTEGGFHPLSTSFQFVFPRPLAWFRRIEPALSRWPLGAQYMILCRKT